MKDIIHPDMFIMVGSFIVKERGVMIQDVGVLVSDHD